MNINEVIEKLKSLNEDVPIPPRLPSIEEIEEIEKYFKYNFPKDYKKFLLKASNVIYGFFEPALAIKERKNLYLKNIVEEAWKFGLPRNLFPFCLDNGDYYCFNKNQEVVYWDHNGLNEEKWKSFTEWVEKVWIKV